MGSFLKSRSTLGIGLSGVLAAVTFVGVAMAGDPGRGQQVFRAQCAVCHSAAAHSGPMVGPRLFGVVGRRAGTQAGFSYSAAMKQSGIVWTPDALKRYIANPSATVHGNKMPYAGLHNPAQVDDLVSYLGTLR